MSVVTPLPPARGAFLVRLRIIPVVAREGERLRHQRMFPP
jgi:hypothetical protein